MPGPPILAHAVGPSGVLFEQALVALVDVLDAGGEPHWRDWMAGDLDRWRTTSRDVEHHRRAYGGMGSFNDVPWMADPWLHGAFVQLRSIAEQASRAAGPPDRTVDASTEILSTVGVMRCGRCGARFASRRHVDYVAGVAWASWVVPRLVVDGAGDDVLPAARGARVPDTRQQYLTAVLDAIGHVDLVDSARGSTPCPACGSATHTSIDHAVF